MKNMRKKLIMVLAILAITLMSNHTAFAAITSGSGTTSGGTSGKTDITYKMTCSARVGGYVDQTIIYMKAASQNTINMSYYRLRHTSRSGALSDPVSATVLNVNSKTWTTTAGNNGSAYSSNAENYKATSTGFGTWTKKNVHTTF